jgi:hypothetical protein
MFSGTVAAIESTFAAATAVVEVVGPELSVFFVHPERAKAPIAAKITAKRHTFPRLL